MGEKLNWYHLINSETKLVIFRHHRADPKPAPHLMSGHAHKQYPCLECQLGLKLTACIYFCHLCNVWFLLSFKGIPDSFCQALSFQASDQTKNGVFGGGSVRFKARGSLKLEGYIKRQFMQIREEDDG